MAANISERNQRTAKMDEDLPTAELLRRLQAGDQDALTTLFQRFCVVAHEIALKKLAKFPQAVREAAGKGNVGIEALKSTLSYVGRLEKKIDDRNEFVRILRGVIRYKIVDIARHESESIKKREDLGELDPVDPGTMPLEILIRKETDSRLANLADRVTTLIYETEDEIQLMVGVLGVLQFNSATEIQKALASAYPDEPLPAKATIHVWLRNLRKRLARELGGEFVDE